MLRLLVRVCVSVLSVLEVTMYMVSYCYFAFEFVDLICEHLDISYVRQWLFIMYTSQLIANLCILSQLLLFLYYLLHHNFLLSYIFVHKFLELPSVSSMVHINGKS